MVGKREIPRVVQRYSMIRQSGCQTTVIATGHCSSILSYHMMPRRRPPLLVVSRRSLVVGRFLNWLRGHFLTLDSMSYRRELASAVQAAVHYRTWLFGEAKPTGAGPSFTHFP